MRELSQCVRGLHPQDGANDTPILGQVLIDFYFGKLHILTKIRSIIDVVGLTFQQGATII